MTSVAARVKPGVFAWAAILCVFTTGALAEGTHCSPAETTVFSCSVGLSKVASVCLLKGIDKTPSSIAYRFGRVGAAELIFPDSALGSLAKFRYALYVRPQVSRSELNFSTAGAEYSVFDYFDGDQRPKNVRGVSVTKDGKLRDFHCRSAATSNLVQLETLVPCDAGNALASCN